MFLAFSAGGQDRHWEDTYSICRISFLPLSDVPIWVAPDRLRDEHDLLIKIRNLSVSKHGIEIYVSFTKNSPMEKRQPSRTHRSDKIVLSRHFGQVMNLVSKG